MTFRVAFTPEAEEQLVDLYRYIAAAGYREAADRYTDSIVTYCEELAEFPYRGRTRDDIRPGLRTIGFRRRVVIAYAIVGEGVLIVGVFYGGRDYEVMLAEQAEDS